MLGLSSFVTGVFAVKLVLTRLMFALVLIVKLYPSDASRVVRAVTMTYHC